jgi:predicted small integral membrane protein
MQENYYPTCRIWAWIAWAVTVALIVAAWTLMLVGETHWRLAFLLGGTGCTTAAVAATLHVRSFMVRLSSLVRAASYRDVAGEGLRPVG